MQPLPFLPRCLFLLSAYRISSTLYLWVLIRSTSSLTWNILRALPTNNIIGRVLSSFGYTLLMEYSLAFLAIDKFVTLLIAILANGLVLFVLLFFRLVQFGCFVLSRTPSTTKVFIFLVAQTAHMETIQTIATSHTWLHFHIALADVTHL